MDASPDAARSPGDPAAPSALGGPLPQLLLGAVCAAYTTGAVLGWGSPRLALVMGDFGLAAAALLAAASCLWYARRWAGEPRAAWILFGIASLAMSLGNAIWGWYEVVQGRPVPCLTAADACFLLFAPLAVVGLLLLAKRPVTPSGWICLALDTWLIGGSLMTLSWSVALTQAAQRQGESVLRSALGLAYPLLDIALVSTVLVLHFRRSPAHRSAINAAIAALALTVLCDALFTSPVLRERYSSGQLLDAGWFAGSLLLAGAPWMGIRPRSAGQRAPRAPAPPPAPGPQAAPAAPIACSLAGLVPYLAAAVCVLSILVTVVAGREVDRVVVLAACAVVLALLVRQGITLRDNASLTRELARKENYFRSLVQGSSDVIMIAAPRGTLRYVSPAATGVYGRDPALLTGTDLSALIHPDDLGRVRSELRRFLSAPAAAEHATRIECRVRHGAGHWLNVESTVKRHEDGLILNSRDVTERVRLQAQLQHSASHDALTDLPNRALFTERVRMAIGGARGGAPAAAVLYIDLDGFKAVNDSAGHQAGDELLVQAAQRLRDSVRAGDTTARLGGDEFAALIVGEPGGEPLRREGRFLEIAERVRAAISRPYLVDGRRLRVAASVGVAFAEAGTAPATLIRRADLAMYRAKQAGKGRVELYAPHHQPPRQAPARRAPRPPAQDRGPGEYALLHQPVVDLADGRVAAVCARPRRPGRPGAGTPAGEAPGWLLEQAVADAARRHREGLTAPVSVRVRADRLADPALSGDGLEALLGRHGLPPGGLIVELPEAGAALASAELRARLSDLGRLGVGLALGGFGSGGTSAAALHRLPVSLLRLDGELVEGLLESPALGTIAAGLLRMAADLGIDSLAGGVDLPAQAAALRALGCRRAQGLAFCEPLEAGRLRRVLGEGSLPVPADARGVPPQADAGRPRALPAPYAARAAPAPGRTPAAPDTPAPRG